MTGTRPDERRRLGPRVGALLGVAAVLLAALIPSATAGTPARPTDVDPWSAAKVTVTPTSALGDGRRISINVKTSSPTFIIESAEAQECRGGVSYAPSASIEPAPDFTLGGDNCPQVHISTSSDGRVSDQYVNPDAGLPAGETFTMKVGTGPTDWTNSVTGKRTSLTCDQDHPCSLVVELRAVQLAAPGQPQQPASWRPFVTQLTFANSDPIAGCGGAAKGVVTSGASDSLQDAWVGWTSAACKLPGQVGALTTANFAGEGSAVSSFAAGNLDMAYTAVGYNADAKLAPADAETKRPAIAVPIGLNAVVLAVGGGYIDPTGRYRPYDTPQLTTAEITALLAGGPQGEINNHLGDIYTRNPELSSPGMFTSQAHAVQLAAPAEAESTSWFATRHLATLDPNDWHVPNLPLFGSDAGRPRGIDSQLALADPSYNQAITLFTGRPTLEKYNDALDATGGGFWALTDLTTADALALVPTQIQNSALQFVGPTADSMAAAVAGMQVTSDGMRVPDPTQTAGYPLTYVEYALVPAQPLADVGNVCRPQSQALLAKWLDYVTGAGQANLPAGLVPLTPELKNEAVADIKKVGAAKAAKPCTAPVTTPPPTTPTTAAPSVTQPPPSIGAGVGSGAPAGFTSTPSSGPTSSIRRAPAKPTLVVAANPHIPGYGGSRVPSALLGLFALVGVIALTAGAAAWSSGWRPRWIHRPSAPPDSVP
jgi:hypothetical protein